MLWGFDVNKMNIWHVYAYIWCPIVKKIGYKLKNEDQVQSLGAILTSPRWKLHTQMPTVHTHTQTHTRPQAQKLPMFLCLLQQAPSQSISVSNILGRSTKLSCHLPRLCQAGGSLLFTFTSQTCAHKLSVNVFLSHI